MCKVNDMMIVINEDASVIDKGSGILIITRPTIFGGVATHTIKTEYTAKQVADWLHAKLYGKARPAVQDAFPNMSPDDREFILSGVTPKVWLVRFPPEKEDDSVA